MELLRTLITVSEKAAIIAREIRKDDELMEKLSELKTEDGNPRFSQDYKTAVDVIIQQMIKHDVARKFPSLVGRIRGEENNIFFHEELNKEITVEIRESEDETAEAFSEIFCGKPEFAKLVASTVHSEVSFESVNTKLPPNINLELDIDKLYIWIDPIDGTNQYLNKSTRSNKEDRGYYLTGVKCVTVLIGVHDDKGIPIIGVINQPFYEDGDAGSYNCHWGICIDQNGTQTAMSSTAPDWKETNLLVLSDSESDHVKEALRESNYKIITPAGAGYKLLLTILGVADGYFLSKSSTFFWDTCGPQAILRALGGDLVKLESGKIRPGKDAIVYNPKSPVVTNISGFLAYRDETTYRRLLNN